MACKWCTRRGNVTVPDFHDGWDVELLPPLQGSPDGGWVMEVDTYGKFKRRISFPVNYCPFCGRRLEGRDDARA